MKNDVAQKNGRLLNFIDNIQGDKVIWMITIMLILFSIVTIFSSTTLLVTSSKSRLDIFVEQMYTVAAGIAIIFICYKIPYIWIFRTLSQLGYIVSISLLACLVLRIGTEELNDAVRSLKIAGFQVHVYEIVKVAMVMYLAWAMNSLENNSFWITRKLAEKFKWLSWINSGIAQKWIYIFIPILSVCVCILEGSASSAIFIGGIMFITVFVGGIKIRDMLVIVAMGIIGLAVCIGAYYMSGGKVFKRVGTVKERLAMNQKREDILELTPGTIEFQHALDKIKQPESAKLAVKEGGLIGKLPGGSTQKYVVPLIFSDYMYSFIIEEYGLIGGILIFILYTSLLARGSLIVRSCENNFAKTAVAGLTVLISGQAMMHMFINADVGLLTGQTLPMISHGTSSFLAFSVAFGVLLSISKMAKKNIDKKTMEAEPLIKNDDVQAGLNDLDEFDTELNNKTA